MSNWSASVPADEGYYWWKKTKDDKPGICRLTIEIRNKVIINRAWWPGNESESYPNLMGGWWKGPIKDDS